jgi:hypothetical protein
VFCLPCITTTHELQDLVYGTCYDAVLKAIVKNSRGLEEVLQSKPIQEEIEAIIKLLDAEARGLSGDPSAHVSADQMIVEDDDEPETRSYIQFTPAEIALDADGKLTSYTDYADRYVRQFCTLIQDTECANSLRDVGFLVLLAPAKNSSFMILAQLPELNSSLNHTANGRRHAKASNCPLSCDT